MGGDFIVDNDKYAERDFPNDSLALQNDLDVLNKIVKEGEQYGYNYNTHIRRSAQDNGYYASQI
ncbi:hypothetical protein MASR1M65_15060 [Saprospiraceae bacterium]